MTDSDLESAATIIAGSVEFSNSFGSAESRTAIAHSLSWAQESHNLGRLADEVNTKIMGASALQRTSIEISTVRNAQDEKVLDIELNSREILDSMTFNVQKPKR